MFKLSFWREAFERAVKSAAQGATLIFVAGELINGLVIDYKLMLGFAVGGGVQSILYSLASVAVTGAASASLAAPQPVVTTTTTTEVVAESAEIVA